MNDHATAMLRTHSGLAVLLFVLGLGVAQALYSRAELPERVASHFNAAGKPDDWTSRDGLVKFQCGMLLAMGGLFGLSRRWMGVMPTSLVNLPNKEFWLAPERRAQSLDLLARWMHWIGAATLAFLMLVFQFTVQANLRNGSLNMPLFLTLTGFYLAGIIVASVWIYRRFRIPMAERS